MVSHVVLDDAPAWLDRLEVWMILRCTQNARPSGFGSLVEPPCWRGSKFFTKGVQVGLSHSRRPGPSLPGQPGPELVLTTLGRGDAVFHQAMVVRGLVQDEKGACWELREQWLGTPRGAMLPVHVPLIIAWPFRSLQDQRGPWDPAGRRPGMDQNQPWPLARWLVDPRPLFFKIPGKRTGMVLLHDGLSAGHLWPLQAALGGAVGSLLTQGASACEDNLLAFLQGCTARPGARRQAPALQRPPQGDGRDSGMRGLKERRPQGLHTDTLASSILGADIRTNDGVESHGRTILRLPARCRRLGRHGVPMVTIRGHKALDRDCPNIQALGWAYGGMSGRYCLRVLPRLIKMEFEVDDPLFHGWSTIFPLKRHRYDRKVGGKQGCGCRYQCQSGHG
jgi:hypothetical protein